VKILHLADVHLDRPFVGLPEEARKRRREELRDALRRCLAEARDRRVDLVTIGGDLWEDEHVTTDTRGFVAHELGRLAPIRAAIVCGNHDPLVAGGNYRRTPWPSNVRVFDGVAPSELPVGDVSVWGTSWLGQGLDLSFLERFNVPDDGRTHLLLLHGTLRTIPQLLVGEGGGAYAPFDPADVERCGFRLCLAGHVHAGGQRGLVVYPGSPEPLGWAEHGRHCVAIVDVERDRVNVEIVDVNRRRYEERHVDCEGAATSAEVMERIEAALRDPDPEAIYLRVTLGGEITPDCRIDPEALATPHRERYAGLVIRDGTASGFDLADLSRQPTAVGAFVQAMRHRVEEAPEGEEREIARLALQAGLRALHGRKDVLRVD
jgi:DNA repair exonuclease SbcCD nuclease subunit